MKGRIRAVVFQTVLVGGIIILLLVGSELLT